MPLDGQCSERVIHYHILLLMTLAFLDCLTPFLQHLCFSFPGPLNTSLITSSVLQEVPARITFRFLWPRHSHFPEHWGLLHCATRLASFSRRT
ncbi:hypothetical protein BGZ60DRAFT_412160 [Tricladium varicosporioides]|nr:hypothetical protein BGZ60DRAFT_412160 [Hymenoscyphus varicosporioides]